MIILLLRFLVGGLFVFSGVLKMTDLISFQETIDQFNILPPRLTGVTAVFIPAFELVCGLFLIIGIYKKATAQALMLLLAIFSIAIGINIYRGASFSCGCFGPLQIFNTISFSSILFDLWLIALLGYVYYKDSSPVTIEYQEQHKTIMIYSIFIALLLQIPFANASMINTINREKMHEIDWELAYEILDNEGGVLFDARAKERYDEGHVPGSKLWSVFDFNKYYALYKGYDRSTKILVYCDWTYCTASHKLADKIINRGFSNVYVIPEGWQGWLERK